jgi:hypothetical protein
MALGPAISGQKVARRGQSQAAAQIFDAPASPHRLSLARRVSPGRGPHRVRARGRAGSYRRDGLMARFGPEKILVCIDATNDAAFSSFDNRHSQPPAFRARTASPGPNAWTGQSRDHEGQALLGSQASARQNPTARRSWAADRSGERHGRSIGMRVRPHRAPCGASLAGGSIAVRVRPPGNWRLSSDCRNDVCNPAAAFVARLRISEPRSSAWRRSSD